MYFSCFCFIRHFYQRSFWHIFHSNFLALRNQLSRSFVSFCLKNFLPSLCRGISLRERYLVWDKGGEVMNYYYRPIGTRRKQKKFISIFPLLYLAYLSVIKKLFWAWCDYHYALGIINLYSQLDIIVSIVRFIYLNSLTSLSGCLFVHGVSHMLVRSYLSDLISVRWWETLVDLNVMNVERNSREYTNINRDIN